MKKSPHYPYYEHKPVGTLKELLEFCASDYGTKPAFQYRSRKHDVEVSYLQFRDDVFALGVFLLESGLAGAHIGIIGENSYEWILVHFAVTCGRGVIIPIDKDLNSQEIERLLVMSDCSVIFYSENYSSVTEHVKEKHPEYTFYNINAIPEMIKKGKSSTGPGKNIFAEQKIQETDLASIIFTSGTTGLPKGVMLTHKNFCSCMYGATCNVLLSGPSLLLLPLHHAFGLVAGVFSVMFYGFPIYINTSLRHLSDDFQRCQPEHIFAVPLIVETLYKTIWTNAKKQGKDRSLKLLINCSDVLSKCGINLKKVFLRPILDSFGGKLDLIVSGGAPIDEKYIKSFQSFGITILNGYGITECSPIVAVNRNEYPIPESVGVPLCCNEVKISPTGEVLVKGENVMAGYYRNDSENQKAFSDGWFKTGDLGFMDEHGALHITGRIKNLIILSNGENIPAEMIEKEICSMIPYVKEVVAYGEGNTIVAEMFLDEGVNDGQEQVNRDIRLVNQHLPLNRNVGRIVIREVPFPKTTTQKIKRNYGGKEHA